MVQNISNLNTQKMNMYPNFNDTYSVVPVKTSKTELHQYGSVNFTSGKKKENFLQKHLGKILLSATVITAGVFLTKGRLWNKSVSFEKIQKNLIELLHKKELSKEETNAILKKYKEIYRIKDKKQYITELFEQVKKDFGYSNKNIFLELKDEKMEFTDIFKHKGVGGFQPGTGKMHFNTALNKKEIFISMFHEFTHVKQHEIAFRTIGAKERTFQKYINEVKETDPKMYNKNKNEVIRLVKNKINKIFEKKKLIYGDLPKFKEGSAEAILGKKYIDAGLNYIQAEDNVKKYKNNLLEQGAYKTEPLAKEILKYIFAMK